MAGSTIGSHVTIGVTLGIATGGGTYASPLTITSSGDIAPTSYGAVGLYASFSGGYVLNDGTISGGVGSASGTGGIAVDLLAGSLTNFGTIVGGSAGFGGTGGVGVSMTSGTLRNNLQIEGGSGGGTGVVLAGGTLNNQGFIVGGTGTGIGLYVIGGTIANIGGVGGGTGGGSSAGGGAGVVFRNGGTLSVNSGISGGPGVGAFSGSYGQAIEFGSGASRLILTPSAFLRGVVSANAAFADTLELTGVGGTLSQGIGTGYLGFDSLTIDSGAQWVLHNPTITAAGVSVANDGTVVGQYILPSNGGGRGGGDGISLVSGSLTNHGKIAGGHGASGYGTQNVNGGAGVYIDAGVLTNMGTIVGGQGGYGSKSLHNGATSGLGGTGVGFSAGGTLIDSGYVGGGLNASAAGIGMAVNFGTGAANLLLHPGATLNGDVASDASFNNVLDLASGGGTGTIGGLGNTITDFGTIDFGAGAPWLVSGNTAGIAAGQTIEGFASGDSIELTGFVATSDTFTAGGLVLHGGGTATIGITGSFSTSDFVVTNDGTNSFIALQPACFMEGTRIATQSGDVAVEALRVGDVVQALHMERATVVWIGHRTIDCRRHPAPHQVWPVRIRAGAFADDAPRRDLYLSPDHAVMIDGVLIPIRYLINDTSIAQMAMDRVTYFHVELARHDVVLAEGLPAESYLDRGDRALFANADLVRLFGRFNPTDACTTWEAAGCAPLVITGPLVEAARAALAAGEGHARDSSRRRRRSVA